MKVHLEVPTESSFTLSQSLLTLTTGFFLCFENTRWMDNKFEGPQTKDPNNKMDI